VFTQLLGLVEEEEEEEEEKKKEEEEKEVCVRACVVVGCTPRGGPWV
jgi:hypothetical protein